jgi:type I restriction enzyme M protein
VLTSLVLDLVGRITELGERYGETLGDLEAGFYDLSPRVAGYLAQMGVT